MGGRKGRVPYSKEEYRWIEAGYEKFKGYHNVWQKVRAVCVCVCVCVWSCDCGCA